MGSVDLTHRARLDCIRRRSSIVVFMIVFYVGYCYSRYVEIFHDVEIIIRSIINACVLARTCFESEEDEHKDWRYLNLLHAAAYCGLTNSYNHDNFFYPLIEKYGLAGTGVHKEIETRDLKAIDIDETHCSNHVPGPDAGFDTRTRVQRRWLRQFMHN